eukprot:scaffold218685_cov30-Tisochrysis_lutea.AAC.4
MRPATPSFRPHPAWNHEGLRANAGSGGGSLRAPHPLGRQRARDTEVSPSLPSSSETDSSGRPCGAPEILLWAH